jgi:uncharacterized protein YndB with AHSA1/START domain
MVQFEEQIVIAAPPEKVFALYANVAAWSSWDPDVKTSSIEGAFSSGVSGSLQPSSGPKVRVKFTEVMPDRSFTVESKLPLCVLRFEHELTLLPSGTNAKHRVTFQGLLSPFFGQVIGPQIRKALPNAMQALKRAAEH